VTCFRNSRRTTENPKYAARHAGEGSLTLRKVYSRFRARKEEHVVQIEEIAPVVLLAVESIGFRDGGARYALNLGC
jgi:hypothetical protein